MRSLTPTLIRKLGFKRTESNSEYISEWTEVDEIGNSVAMEMKEYYLYNAPRGYFLSLSYPKREKAKADIYWQTIRSSFEVKE